MYAQESRASVHNRALHTPLYGPTLGTCAHRGSDMASTNDFLGAERVLQRLRDVRGQDDATETDTRITQ